MKKGWRQARLRDAGVAVRDQAQLNTGQTYELWSVPAFDGRNPEVVRGADVGSAKLRVQPDDVLICKINPRINRVWVVQSRGELLDQIASPEWIVFRPHRATLDSEFAAYYLSGPSFREWIASSVRGATGSHSRARAEDVLDQFVPLPPLAEQRRIVGILDEAFEGIATATANAEKNLEGSRALFEIRLASLLARSNGPWVRQPLGEVCETGSGGTPKSTTKAYYEGGTIPWLVSGEVGQGEVFAATRFITESGLENSSAKVFPPGSVLVAMYGATAGEVGILRIHASTNQAVCAILPNGRFVPRFMYYVLLAKKEELVAQAVGNAQPNISQAKVREVLVPMATLREQAECVERLDELRAHSLSLADGYQQKLDALDELKRSLLHHAFSGAL